MSRVNKSWMAAVAGILLVGTLVGVVWARPNHEPRSQDILRKVTLTGADFVPMDDTDDWRNVGYHVRCDSGECSHKAPVEFPCLASVTVERIKVHVTDNNESASATATLYRTYPPTGGNVWLGAAGSPEGIGSGVRTYTSGNINQVVWPSQRAYISLHIRGPNIHVHGVTVEYRRNI